MHSAVGKYQINPGHGGIAKGEIAVSVGAESVQIKGCVRGVGAAIVENDHQSIERRVASASIIEFDEFACVSPGLIRVDFVDDDIGCRRRRR